MEKHESVTLGMLRHIQDVELPFHEKAKASLEDERDALQAQLDQVNEMLAEEERTIRRQRQMISSYLARRWSYPNFQTVVSPFQMASDPEPAPEPPKPEPAPEPPKPEPVPESAEEQDDTGGFGGILKLRPLRQTEEAAAEESVKLPTDAEDRGEDRPRGIRERLQQFRKED